MRVLALDLSGSNTGWAIYSPGQLAPISGAKPLCENQKQFAGACVALHKMLHAMHTETPFDLIVREAPLVLRTDTVDNLLLTYGLATHAASYAKAIGVPCEPVEIRSWRTTFLGSKIPKGLDKKRLAVLRCRQYGLDPVTHDEAEAIGVLTHTLLKRKIVPPWVAAHPLIEPLF